MAKQIQFQDVLEIYQPLSEDNLSSHTKTVVTVEDYDKQRKRRNRGNRRIRRTRQPRMSQRLRARATRVYSPTTKTPPPTTTILPVSELAGEPTTTATETVGSKSRWKARRNRKASLLQSQLGKDRFATDATNGRKNASKANAKKQTKGSLDVAPKVPRRSSFGDDEEDDPVTSDTCEGFSSGYSSSDSAAKGSQRSISRTMGSLLVQQPARFAKSARRRLRVRAQKRRQELVDKHSKSGEKEEEDSDGDDSIEDETLDTSFHHIHSDEATEITLSTPPDYVRKRSIDIDALEISFSESDDDDDALLSDMETQQYTRINESPPAEKGPEPAAATHVA
ncbi:MAG: hypothetical protein SGARI_005651 [Bacillariaceae sp.]